MDFSYPFSRLAANCRLVPVCFAPVYTQPNNYDVTNIPSDIPFTLTFDVDAVF
jgi:hypothetical protein